MARQYQLNKELASLKQVNEAVKELLSSNAARPININFTRDLKFRNIPRLREFEKNIHLHVKKLQ